MSVDIVCAEGELSMAVNSLTAYADFLARTIEAYIAVLSDIQTKGIQDDLVCAKLSSLALALQPYKTTIKTECEDIAADVQDYINGISDADNFTFPADITESMTSLLDKFL